MVSHWGRCFSAFLVSLVDLTIPQEERKSSCGIVIKHFYIIDIILIIQYVNDIILIKTKQFTTYLSNLPTPARILSRFQIMLFNNVS